MDGAQRPDGQRTTRVAEQQRVGKRANVADHLLGAA